MHDSYAKCRIRVASGGLGFASLKNRNRTDNPPIQPETFDFSAIMQRALGQGIPATSRLPSSLATTPIPAKYSPG